jgi:predicted PurR-regulated permease PerM
VTTVEPSVPSKAAVSADGDTTPSISLAVAPILSDLPRRASLTLLAVLACVFSISWAQAFLVPLLFGIVISYTLTPLVAWLEAIKVPRVIGTIIVMAGVVGAIAFGGYSVRGQVQAVIEQLPGAATKFVDGLAHIQQAPIGNLQIVQDAAAQVEEATTKAAEGDVSRYEKATEVVVVQPSFKLGRFLWGNSMNAIGALGQTMMVLFLVFFLLIGGDSFKRKLVRLTGPTLSNKKSAVHILDGINASIQKYMLMLLATNLLVGLLCWTAFRWLGLENAGAWAAAAGLLHLIPYLGPAVTAAAIGMAGFMQFGSFGMVIALAGTSLMIATLVGTFVTTWMTGRIASMNPAAVFISLLFWGWLWGIWGLLLGVPIVVILKVISQHLPSMRPIADLLGD